MKISDDHETPDLRAEFIAADLTETGKTQDEIVIVPEGQFKRGYHKDVLKRYAKDLLRENQPVEFIAVSRDGLYDYLPEGVFHKNHSLSLHRKLKESLQRIQEIQQEEQEARKFFLALEREFYRQRIALEIKERKNLQISGDSTLRKQLLELWEELPQLEEKIQSVLLYLLPLSSHLVGKNDLIAECFKMILGVNVAIEKCNPVEHDIPDELSPRLGEATLGVDFALGGILQDGIPAVAVTIGPLSAEDIHRFLPGETQLLDILCHIFFAIDIDIHIDIQIELSAAQFMISDASFTGRLGYSTVL